MKWLGAVLLLAILCGCSNSGTSFAIYLKTFDGKPTNAGLTVAPGTRVYAESRLTHHGLTNCTVIFDQVVCEQNTDRDTSRSSIWTSSEPSVALIPPRERHHGSLTQIEAVGPGRTQICASFEPAYGGLLRACTTLTVTN
jgi:hypothetical protein